MIRNIYDLEAVALFDPLLGRMDTAGECRDLDEQMAREAYLQDRDLNDPTSKTLQRSLRLGTERVGGLALRGEFAMDFVDPLASLTAMLMERYHSFDRKNHAGAARQSEELRTAVLDALAHAFKTPLTVIRAASTGLIEMRGLTPQQQQLTSLIDQESLQLNSLTTRLLKTARLESSDFRLEYENIAIAPPIQGVLREQAPKLSGHPVELEIDDVSLRVEGDAGLIATIVTEFVDNAAKYSDAGSPIRIAASRRPSEVLISVHNYGSIIPIEDRDKIFQRYHRSPANTGEVAGTGIGLSVAKKAATAHHGHVWVISADGEGTTFYLSLPTDGRDEI